jgi:hypothetical protein
MHLCGLLEIDSQTKKDPLSLPFLDTVDNMRCTLLWMGTIVTIK